MKDVFYFQWEEPFIRTIITVGIQQLNIIRKKDSWLENANILIEDILVMLHRKPLIMFDDEAAVLKTVMQAGIAQLNISRRKDEWLKRANIVADGFIENL